MNVVKRKLSRYRILKTISYLIGFPLLIFMVFMCTMKNFVGQEAFADTAYNGLLVAILLWLGVLVFQVVFCLFVKSHKARTLFTICLSVGVILVTAIVFDSYASKTVEEMQTKYEEYNVTIEDYDYQINWFAPLTSDKTSLTDTFNDSVDDFLRIYNIGYMSDNVGAANTDLTVPEYNAEDDAYYSANGMYSDGYIFGIKQAMYLLTTYHETQQYYKSIGKDADVVLAEALQELEENPDSEWNYYKQSDEYQDAYGEDGEAYKYMLSVERLNLILSALGRELEDDISGLGNLISFIGVENIGDLLGYINQDLNVSIIVEAVNTLGLFEEDITEEEILEILKDFSFYQSPKAKPIFSFIEDEMLKEYGYVTYYANVHGAKVGSVLIGKDIGHIDMDHNGYPGYTGFTQDQLYQLQADLEYKPALYPYFALRRYLYLFAGIVGLSSFLTVHFANKEKEIFDTLTQEVK